MRTCRACERWCCRPGKSTARHAACRDQAPTGHVARGDCQSSAVHSPGAARTCPQSQPATHRHIRPFTSLQCFDPSVLCHCWLGGRKGIRPLKTEWWALAWLSVWSEVQTCICPSWCHCHSLSLASVKSRLALPFWYRLTRVVSEKGPLNGCVCMCVCYKSTGWAKKVGPHSWPNFCQILTDLKKFYRKIPR